MFREGGTRTTPGIEARAVRQVQAAAHLPRGRLPRGRPRQVRPCRARLACARRAQPAAAQEGVGVMERTLSGRVVDAQLVLDVLHRHARPLILKHYRKDSCAVSTRVAVETARAFGIRAKPLAVDCLCYNAKAQEQMVANVPKDDWPDDAWSVGISHMEESDAGGLGRHVVALIDGDHFIDLAADQFDRPAKNLRVPEPVIGPASPEFLAGDEPCPMVAPGSQTLVLYLTAGAPDWSR